VKEKKETKAKKLSLSSPIQIQSNNYSREPDGYITVVKGGNNDSSHDYTRTYVYIYSLVTRKLCLT